MSSSVKITIGSLQEAKELTTVIVVGPFSSASWRIDVPVVNRLDEAPGMVKVLKKLRREATTLSRFVVKPFAKLKTVARINGKLSEAATTVRNLIRHPANRDGYHFLSLLAGEICGTADHLPRPPRRAITKVGNQIRRAAKKGNKSGGQHMVDRLRALLPVISELRSQSVCITPEEAAPAPAPVPAPTPASSPAPAPAPAPAPGA